MIFIKKNECKIDSLVSAAAKTHVIDSRYLCFDIYLFVDLIKPEDTRDDVRDDGKTGTTTDENKEGTFDYEGM